MKDGGGGTARRSRHSCSRCSPRRPSSCCRWCCWSWPGTGAARHPRRRRSSAAVLRCGGGARRRDVLGFQHDASLRPESIASRLAAAGWVIWFYLASVVAPVRLTMVYPRWEVDPTWLPAWIPLLALVVLAVVCWQRRDVWGRPVLAALVVFVAMLVPVLGLSVVVPRVAGLRPSPVRGPCRARRARRRKRGGRARAPSRRPPRRRGAGAGAGDRPVA